MKSALRLIREGENDAEGCRCAYSYCTDNAHKPFVNLFSNAVIDLHHSFNSFTATRVPTLQGELTSAPVSSITNRPTRYSGSRFLHTREDRIPYVSYLSCRSSLLQLTGENTSSLDSADQLESSAISVNENNGRRARCPVRIETIPQ